MAIVYTYPIGSPAVGDLLVGTKTPVEGEAFEPNKTLNFTVQSIIDLIEVPDNINGTVGKIPVFTTTTTVGDSIITQNTNGDKISVEGGLNLNGNVTSTYNAADTNTGAYGVSRTLSGLTVNARGYRDNTIITAPGNNTVSYAGIDLKSQSTNGTYGHVTMLQGRHSLDAANLTDFEGLYIGGLDFTNSSSATNYVGVTVENPTLFNGSITNFIGTNIKAPARSGGAITNFYGLKIEDNVSATNKWSIYSEDTSVKSKMLGQLESGDISVYNTGTSASLHLNSSSTAFGGNYIHAKKSDNSNQWVLGSNSGSDNRVTLKQYNDADIVFQNNSGAAVTIKSSGNVGIGTTTVNAKLNVNGSVKIDGTNPLYFGGSGSIPAWQINASGNDLVINDVGANSGDLIFSGQKMGIGTSTPSSKLEVDGGDIEIDNSASGLILRSPDGTRYRVTVANGGTLSVSAV